MALNDAISAVLEKVGLKKSDVEKCRDAILVHEERIKDLNDELAGRLDDAQRLERALRDLKAKYDAATPASKRLLESQIRSLMSDFSGLKEMQDIILRNLDKEKLLLRNRRIELEHLRHPTDIDTVIDAQDRKEAMVSDLKEEDVEVAELAGHVYSREENVPSSTAESTDKDSADALGREIDALIGTAETKPTVAVSDGGNGATAVSAPLEA